MNESMEKVQASLYEVQGAEIGRSGNTYGPIKVEEGTELRYFNERDWTHFYTSVHDVLYSEGFSPKRIGDIIGSLWQHNIDGPASLTSRCEENYYLVKKEALMNDTTVILTFESVTEWNLKQYNNKFDVTIKKGAKFISLGEVDPDLLNIKRIAREQLSIPIANFEFHAKKGNITIEVKHDSDFTGLVSPLQLTVDIKQIGFSSVPNLKAALDMCGDGAVHEQNLELGDFMSEDAEKAITDRQNFGEELEHAYSTIQRLQKVLFQTTGGEETKRSYILPVVVAAALISGDIRIEEERTTEAPFAHGPVDYVFIYGDAIICVTEAKDGDMKKGLTQNIAQLAATRNERKRKFNHMGADGFTYYGIATTYVNWQLIELDGNVVKSSVNFGSGGDLKNCIETVIKHLVNVLEKSKTHYPQQREG